MMVLHTALDGSWKPLYTCIVSFVFLLVLTCILVAFFAPMSSLCINHGTLATLFMIFSILYTYFPIFCMILWWMIYMNIMPFFMVALLSLWNVVHPYLFCLAPWYPLLLACCSPHVYLIMIALWYILVVDPCELLSCLCLVLVSCSECVHCFLLC
jgi:hypothetical protein